MNSNSNSQMNPASSDELLRVEGGACDLCDTLNAIKNALSTLIDILCPPPKPSDLIDRNW